MAGDRRDGPAPTVQSMRLHVLIAREHPVSVISGHTRTDDPTRHDQTTNTPKPPARAINESRHIQNREALTSYTTSTTGTSEARACVFGHNADVRIPTNDDPELIAAIRRFVSTPDGALRRYLKLLHGNFAALPEPEHTEFLRAESLDGAKTMD